MSQYIEIAVKDSDDVYYIKNLSVADIRLVVNKCMSLLTPVIGDGIDSYAEAERNNIIALLNSNPEELGSIQPENVKFFSAFSILGAQLDNPLVIEIQDLLLKGAKHSTAGKVQVTLIDSLPNYNIDSVYGEKAFVDYMKVLKFSFEKNAYGPFVSCLGAMGFSEIVGKVQAVLKSKLPNS